MKISTIIALLVVSGFAVSSAQAASIFIQNHSFEDPNAGNGIFIVSDSSGPPGWNIHGPTGAGTRFFGVLNPSGTTLYTEPVPDGDNVGVVFLSTPGVAAGGLEQILADTLQLNTQYTLRVDVGNIANDPNPPHNAFNFSGFPGYRIELLAGSTIVASDHNTLTISEGAFETSTILFSTGSFHPNENQALGIRLMNLNGGGIEVNFDNVRLDAIAVPEPSTVALLFGGLALSTAFFRRRKK
jgi:hypothetical protein